MEIDIKTPYSGDNYLRFVVRESRSMQRHGQCNRLKNYLRNSLQDASEYNMTILFLPMNLC